MEKRSCRLGSWHECVASSAVSLLRTINIWIRTVEAQRDRKHHDSARVSAASRDDTAYRNVAKVEHVFTNINDKYKRVCKKRKLLD